MYSNLRIFVFTLLLFGVSSTVPASENPFLNYRYDPFQFSYKEYHYKADVVVINESSKPSVKLFDLFGITAGLPEKYMGKIQKTDAQIQIKSDHGTLLFRLEKEHLMGCTNKKIRSSNLDFCSAFDSTQGYYQKLFTLTPENIGESRTKGDLWIIHEKGVAFEYVTKLTVFEGKDFKGYLRIFNNPDLKIRQEIVIFHDRAPEKGYIVMATTIADDDLIANFLSSLR